MQPIKMGIVAAVIVLTAVGVRAEEIEGARFVEVTGVGLVTQSPDIAHVTFAVETQEPSAEAANRKNAEKIDRLLRDLRRHGIAGDDLRTQHYTVSPRYRDRSRGERDLEPIGYVVSNALEVTIRKLDRVGPTIDRAIAAGATRVNHIRFELENDAAARKRALELAVAHAKAEAEILLALSGQRLGKPLRIRTSGGHFGAKMERSLMSATAMDTAIEPGTLETRAHVTIAYEILD